MFSRDESKMHYAPSVVIMTMPVVVITLVLSLIFLTIQFIRGESWVVAAIVATTCSLWGIFCDLFFTFNERCRIDIKNDYIEYKYDLNSEVIASSNKTCTVRIKNLRKYRVFGKYITFYGDITIDRVFKKRQSLKKIKLPINFSEKSDILRLIQEFKERSLSNR